MSAFSGATDVGQETKVSLADSDRINQFLQIMFYFTLCISWKKKRLTAMSV